MANIKQKKVVWYFDESGHTGSNYLEKSQPIFVEAGVLVTDSKQQQIANLVGELEGAFPDSKEVKGSRLLTTSKGLGALRVFIEGLFSNGIMPIFHVWEKRYNVALRMVDVFLDPEFNERAKWLPTTANDSRSRVANQLLEQLRETQFVQFMSTYRSPTTEGFRETIESVSLTLELSGSTYLADAIRGNHLRLSDLVEAESAQGGAFLKSSVARSLNYPAFNHLMSLADSICENCNFEGELIHDETKEFGQAFARLFNMRKGDSIGANGIAMENGFLRANITSIRGFRTGNSQLEAGIRAADYVASAVRGSALYANALIPPSESLKRIGSLLFPALISHAAYATASEPFISKLQNSIVDFMLDTMRSEEKP